ncbi:MAG: glycoside hydrolase family 16 protein [Mucilaginibacter sp.]|nr:glycoside hydrolase family 16 protein [Mucilaginibacter sp.]
MKTSTLFKYLPLIALFISFGSCKKNSSLPGNPAPTNVVDINPVLNPIIAHTTGNYDFNDTTLTDKGWTKTFEDNFDGDLSKWNIWTGGGFQQELQCYQASNLQIVGGVLQISAKNETVTGPISLNNDTVKSFNYTSGAIQCKTDISANTTTPKVRIVARIKIANGYGLATAFWSFGDNWPQQGEIDYLEARGDDPTKYFTDYFYGPTLNKSVVAISDSYEENRTDGDLSSGYHVYTMEWSKNSLTSYIDGQVVETKVSAHVADLFGKTEHITLNLAVGGLLFNALTVADIAPGTMYVDYVKVFTSK